MDADDAPPISGVLPGSAASRRCTAARAGSRCKRRRPVASVQARRSLPSPKWNCLRSHRPDETLLKIIQDIGDCHRCRLHEARNKIVFGVGNEQAPLVFVGEGPGADEDAQGIPFVGRAGQLLTQMIEGTAKKEGIPLHAQGRLHLQRGEVPAAGESHTRARRDGDLRRSSSTASLSAIRPKAICALGGTAAQALSPATRKASPRCAASGSSGSDIPVMVTYHPSYLLRPYNQNAKREAWEDLKKVLHFVYD